MMPSGQMKPLVYTIVGMQPVTDQPSSTTTRSVDASAAPRVADMKTIVPAPVSVSPGQQPYRITDATAIRAEAGSAAATRIAERLADWLRPATGFPLPVGGEQGEIALLLSGADAELGDEGYQLDVTAEGITIRANAPAGLCNGVQTLRQLLPAEVESAAVRPGPWLVPGGRVVDRPRYAYRGVMLDVARHFFAVEDVCRFIDEIARYKINHLHLHLSDDQGWRIAIDSWPRLAEHGGRTAVGDEPGGYYTQQDYRRIVDHAGERNITVVPEIDTPGHVNAALAAYPELNRDERAPEPYTGIEVGFSSLCVDKEITYRFLDEVLGELAALTPGPYLHLGGDEAQSTTDADYQTFVDRLGPIVARHGKTLLAWHELGKAQPDPSTVLQFWGVARADPDTAAAAARGHKIIMSPATQTYLDQKYDEHTELGLKWAGYIEVRDAYDWDPARFLTDVPESAILGVEAPLWSETATTLADLEYLTFPRLPAIAELGWSPAETHDWPAFRDRLAAHGPRWRAMGLAFHRSPQIPWPADE
jgi:hexosaminidase